MGQVDLKAEPSAVDNSFTLPAATDNASDIIGYDSDTGDYQYLNNNSGLIDVTKYYDDTTATETTAGSASGYVSDTYIENGDGGGSPTQVPQSSTDYFAHSDGTGTIYPVADNTVYRNEDGTGGLTTNYAYTYYPGSLQIEQATTTAPTVGASQNGPGTAASVTKVYSPLGDLIWTKDADGYVNYYEYDPETGSLLEQIIDADPTAISDAPVAGPARGSGLPTAAPLTTTYTVDDQGRVTEETDPNGNVTYIVYNDVKYASDGSGDGVTDVRVYPGWHWDSSASKYTTTGPVTVYRTDPFHTDDYYIETLTYSSNSYDTLSGAPTGKDDLTTMTIQSDFRDYYNDANQIVREDRYFSLPATWTGSDSYGASNTNFYEATYSYDDRGRLDKIVLPQNTVTTTSTITRKVYDSLGRLTSVWEGTDDSPTSGYWSPENTDGTNMVLIAGYAYDNQGIGDSNLTAVVQHPYVLSGSSWVDEQQRTTMYVYDWRDRLVATKQGAELPHEVQTITVDSSQYLDGIQLQITVDGVTDSIGYAADGAPWVVAGDLAHYIQDSHVYALPTNWAFTQITAYYSGNDNFFTVQSNSPDTHFDIQVSSPETTTFTIANSDPVTPSETGTPGRLLTYYGYDNLNEVTDQQTYAADGLSLAIGSDGEPDVPTGDADKLRAWTHNSYDDQGRVYETLTHSVTDSGDTTGGSLATDYWYDLRGNLIKQSNPGGEVDKYLYDGAGRQTKSYITDGGGDPAPGAANNWEYAGGDNSEIVTGDIVFTQTATQYDHNGNAIFIITKDRLGGSDIGELGNYSTSPVAYVTYMDYYYDAANRLTGSVNLGRDGDPSTDLTQRPDSSIPARSDSKLVTTYGYDAAGRLQTVTDPMGLVMLTLYDALGRTTTTIANYVDNNTGYPDDPIPTDSENQATLYTYDGSNQVLTQTAIVPDGTSSISSLAGTSGQNEITTYTYGVSPSTGSALASNDLLYSITYPDSGGDNDTEYYSYDATGAKIGYTDRNGTTHDYSYDLLGRLVADEATVASGNPEGIDTTVVKLGYSYNDAGLPYQFTSYDSSDGIVNQIERQYNGFEQMTREYQSTSGAVVDSGTGITPFVQYDYSTVSGSVNYSRLDSMVYPSGYEIYYAYDDNLPDRVTGVETKVDGFPDKSAYVDYAGLNMVNGITFEGNGAGNHTFDRDNFLRVNYEGVDNGSGEPVSYQYGYDRDGNVLWKTGDPDGEIYTYDGLNRLTGYQRGDVNGSGNLSGTASVDQSWGLDSQGNWTSVTDNLTSTETDNTFNRQNEATAYGPSPVYYDANGNLKEDASANTYVYDAWNRQVAVTDFVSYGYDALGRRISYNYGAVRGSLYYSNQWQVIEETNSSGAAVYNYVWNPAYIDDMAWREDAGSGDVVYSIADINHNIVAITNSSGEVIERYQYDPYGNVTYYYADGTLKSTQASGYEWSYLFQGKRLDGPGAGQYDFRGRVYDPATGTFDQEDPDGYVNGPNLYQLEGGNPLLRVDPMGTDYGAINTGGSGNTPWRQGPMPKSGGTKDVAIEIDPDAKGKGGGGKGGGGMHGPGGPRGGGGAVGPGGNGKNSPTTLTTKPCKKETESWWQELLGLFGEGGMEAAGHAADAEGTAATGGALLTVLKGAEVLPKLARPSAYAAARNRASELSSNFRDFTHDPLYNALNKLATGTPWSQLTTEEQQAYDHLIHRK